MWPGAARTETNETLQDTASAAANGACKGHDRTTKAGPEEGRSARLEAPARQPNPLSLGGSSGTAPSGRGTANGHPSKLRLRKGSQEPTGAERPPPEPPDGGWRQRRPPFCVGRSRPARPPAQTARTAASIRSRTTGKAAAARGRAAPARTATPTRPAAAQVAHPSGEPAAHRFARCGFGLVPPGLQPLPVLGPAPLERHAITG